MRIGRPWWSPALERCAAQLRPASRIFGLRAMTRSSRLGLSCYVVTSSRGAFPLPGRDASLVVSFRMAPAKTNPGLSISAPAHCEKRPLPTLLCVVRPSWWSLDGCCRTYKASFHAAGAPGAPDLRLLAAVARESSSRVEQVSCGERISRCVSRATRRALIFGLTEGPPLQQIDNYRQHGARRCR